MAAAAVGVSDLLASAITSSLGSTVVTYDQYQKAKKKDEAYFEPLDIDQLFQVTHLYGEFGEHIGRFNPNCQTAKFNSPPNFLAIW